jgi:hypothetical protein
MNCHSPSTLALLWIGTLLLPFYAGASSSDEWRFEVFLDDKPIGFHHFQLSTDGDTRELRGEARFRVKLLGFTVYDYSHQNQERWQNDCLQQIEASTDNDGKDLFVRGSSSGNQMRLEYNGGNSSLSGCVMTFAYWNPVILAQQQLLNAQTGEYLDINVQQLGEKTLQLQGRDIPALHYRLSTDENEIELWYSTERDWLALSTITEGGRQLSYRRIVASSQAESVTGE